MQKKHHPCSCTAYLAKRLFSERANEKTVKARNSFQFKNSPLFLHPEIVDAVREYVYLPKENHRCVFEPGANKSLKYVPGLAALHRTR